MKPIERTQLVISNLFPIATPEGTFVTFPDIPELKTGVVIDGLELYTATQLSHAPTLQANISAADAAKVVLTLNELSTQRVRQIPLLALNPATNFGIWKEFVPWTPNWQSSGFLVTDTLAAGTVFVVCLNVFYRRISDINPNRGRVNVNRR